MDDCNDGWMDDCDEKIKLPMIVIMMIVIKVMTMITIIMIVMMMIQRMLMWDNHFYRQLLLC